MPAYVIKLLTLGLLSISVPGANETGRAAEAGLKIGINPEYPPLVFRQPEGTNGVEIDFANRLSRDLEMPIELVVLRRDELIPALLDRRIDVIMSGMSITRGRQLRIAFTQPYLHNQIRAIFALKSAAQFQTPEDLFKSTARIGVLPGTSAEVLVKQKCTGAQIVPVTLRRDVAFFLLKGNRLDAFVDDTFALADILAQNEADLGYLKQPLAEEDLAWGVRPGDAELKGKLNGMLEKWKLNGTLDSILDRWIPYRKKLTPESTAN